MNEYIDDWPEIAKIKVVSDRYGGRGRPRASDYDYTTLPKLQKELNELRNRRLERFEMGRLRCKRPQKGKNYQERHQRRQAASTVSQKKHRTRVRAHEAVLGGHEQHKRIGQRRTARRWLKARRRNRANRDQKAKEVQNEQKRRADIGSHSRLAGYRGLGFLGRMFKRKQG